MDTDGTVSPVYVAKTHPLTAATNGNYAFDLRSGFDDADGVHHVFKAIAGQFYQLMVLPTTLENGNQLVPLRNMGGFEPNAWTAVIPLDGTTNNLGQIALANTNVHWTAVSMVEIPATDNGASYMTAPKDQWKSYGTANADITDSNAGFLKFSGKVWNESSAGDRFNSVSGPNYNSNTLLGKSDTLAVGYTVVGTILAKAGADAYDAATKGLSGQELIDAIKTLMTEHPEYIAETAYTTTDSKGEYTLRFSKDAVTDNAFDYTQRMRMYEFVLDPNGNPVTAYSPWTVPVFRAPNQANTTELSPTPSPLPNGLADGYYNVDFALVPSDMILLDVTNYNTSDKPAT